MTYAEKRIYLIQALLKEQPKYANLIIPASEQEQKNLLRSLFNIRMPMVVGDDFLEVQDSYLQEEAARKGIIELADLPPVQKDIYLWKGDITRLRCDAIVNAANSQMLGCFCPCHGCIDNQIHTFSGVQLRLACNNLMKEQGHDEPAGRAKITPAYNLPCRFVLHTVGPIIQGSVTKRDEKLLASCYQSCLEIAEEHDIKSIAFCCISTGEFHFPNEKAAEIAIRTVKEFKKREKGRMEMIFNVFKERDYDIYRRLLRADGVLC